MWVFYCVPWSKSSRFMKWSQEPKGEGRTGGPLGRKVFLWEERAYLNRYGGSLTKLSLFSCTVPHGWPVAIEKNGRALLGSRRLKGRLTTSQTDFRPKTFFPTVPSQHATHPALSKTKHLTYCRWSPVFSFLFNKQLLILKTKCQTPTPPILTRV